MREETRVAGENEAQVGFRSTASQPTCNGSRRGIRDL